MESPLPESTSYLPITSLVMVLAMPLESLRSLSLSLFQFTAFFAFAAFLAHWGCSIYLSLFFFFNVSGFSVLALAN